jgi:hypothetical protein
MRSFPSVSRNALFLSTLFCAALAMPRAATVPATVHPNWSKIDLRPAGFQPQVSGMAFLSDGRLVVAHWDTTRYRTGTTETPRAYNSKVIVVSGVSGNTPAVTVDTIARGIEDIMGLAVVNDTIYVSGGNTIMRLNRVGNSGPVTRVDTLFILPGTPVASDSFVPRHGSQEYLNGLLYRGGKFYVSPSSVDPIGTVGTQQVSPYRGTFLEVTPGDGIVNKRGSFRIVANGIRAASGLGYGPEGRFCTSDNQGEWLPSSKLICIQEGKFYGAKKSGGTAAAYYTPWDALTETPPTVYAVHNEISNSPTAPLYIPSGPYAGQMFMGDVRWGTGINRYFLEKNATGDLQGAVFVFTGGLEAGVFRMAIGPDGMLYAGMIGGRNDDDGYPKTQNSSTRVDYGLQKLRYDGGTAAFEMLAVRARPSGFELEFTQPVDTAIAKLTSSYTVQSYYMAPASGYGAGNKTGSTTLTPSAIQISSDGRKVYLALAGIPVSTPTQQRVVYFKLNNFKSAAAATPWATEAWYTLNGAGVGAPFDPPIALQPPTGVAGGAPSDFDAHGPRLRLVAGEGFLRVRVPGAGYESLRLLDAAGRVMRVIEGASAVSETNGWSVVPVTGLHGVVVVEARGPAGRLARAVVLP